MISRFQSAWAGKLPEADYDAWAGKWYNELSPEPFQDLPLLPPAADLETKPVLRACIQARAALAELRQAGDLLPNQAMLVNTIPLGMTDDGQPVVAWEALGSKKAAERKVEPDFSRL